MNELTLPLLAMVLSLSGAVSVANASEIKNVPTGNQMTITIGQKAFTATLEDNATATAFKAMLPLKLNMADLNANEKVVSLPTKLSTNDTNPGRIQAGHLMIWTSRSLVLFYKSFPTSYSYTRLGRIDEPSGLAAALGAGDVSVSFELIPAYQPPYNVLKGGEAQFLVDYHDYYMTPRGYHPRAVNSGNAWSQKSQTTPLSFMNMPLLTHIDEISPRPILLIHGEKAHSRYMSETAFKMAEEPKELLITKGASHTDLYDQIDMIPFDKLTEFFTENLK